MAVVTPTVVRVIVNAGHGLNNSRVGEYDTGASSPFGTEAYIVSRVADDVTDHFFLNHNDECSSVSDISVIPTPLCSIACATTHKNRGHLSYLIEYINDHAIHTKSAGYGDVILSLHMNESPDPDTSGTLVVIAANAPHARYYEAQQISKIVSGVLGIPDKGVMLDTETPRHSIGIVRDTAPPAFLVEMGFVTNANDVKAVETCGADAIKAVIDSLARRR